MVQIIGYTALSLNLISMSMRNVFYLRICGLLANAVYVIYGIMLEAPPVFIGCAIGVLLHSFWIYRILNEQKNKNSR